MGFSKKKAKNWRKAEARVGPKAKQKAKKARQIEGRKTLQDSKRQAAQATGRAKGSAPADDLNAVSAVDELFANMGEEDDMGLAAGADGGSDAGSSDGDESSAGAFHDVDDSEDEGPSAVHGVVEELEEDDGLGPDAGARHAEELRAMKEKDPEFYKFLVEQDRALLNFTAPDDEDEGAGEGEGEGGGLRGADVSGKAGAASERVLTRERLERIQASAKDSFTACKAALNIYHLAVRSIEKQSAQATLDDDEDEEDGGKKGKRKKKERGAAAERKARSRLFVIDDEAIFSEVIEWSIANMLGLLRHHAGELLPAEAGGGWKKRRRARKDEAPPADDLGAGVVNPERYKRWGRVRYLAGVFWEETLFLLNHLVAQQMLEYVLRNCSTPEALSWLWPFTSPRRRYLKRCCALWSTAPAHDVRLLAFLFLRNSAAMVLHSPDKDSRSKGDVPQLQALLRAVIRSFAEAASHGYSWKSLSTFRFMENCIVELLRLDDATAYRLGYVCLRQLALILRNACLAASQGAGAGQGSGAKAKAGAEKGKGKVAVRQQAAKALLAWPFVRALSLWTRAVGAVTALRPLAYPLSMIVMGAVKHKLTSLQLYPFVYHCLDCLNRLGTQLEAFVPVSSHLLKALGVVMQAMDKASRTKGGKQGEGKTLDGSVKAPDLEVVLRLSDAQASEALALETVANSICFLFTDHLGLLSQSPAFPELIAPVMLHLRKHCKHCRSEPLRRQLKALVERSEAAADAVRARREQLDEAPDARKFLLFEPDTPIAKARAEAMRRRANEERSRVEAEMREDAAEAKASKAARRRADAAGADAPAVPRGQNAPGEGTSKRALKRRKAAALKAGLPDPTVEEAAEPAQAPARKRKRPAGEVARRAGALPGRDKVEEMDFGGKD